MTTMTQQQQKQQQSQQRELDAAVVHIIKEITHTTTSSSASTTSTRQQRQRPTITTLSTVDAISELAYQYLHMNAMMTPATTTSTAMAMTETPAVPVVTKQLWQPFQPQQQTQQQSQPQLQQGGFMMEKQDLPASRVNVQSDQDTMEEEEYEEHNRPSSPSVMPRSSAADNGAIDPDDGFVQVAAYSPVTVYQCQRPEPRGDASTLSYKKLCRGTLLLQKKTSSSSSSSSRMVMRDASGIKVLLNMTIQGAFKLGQSPNPPTTGSNKPTTKVPINMGQISFVGCNNSLIGLVPYIFKAPWDRVAQPLHAQLVQLSASASSTTT